MVQIMFQTHVSTKNETFHNNIFQTQQIKTISNTMFQTKKFNHIAKTKNQKMIDQKEACMILFSHVKLAKKFEDALQSCLAL